MDKTLLDIVNQSPAACQAHDKEAWVALFDKYYIVEDPVGSTPHVGGTYNDKDNCRGDGALSRFFETFIQPNDISFDIKQDVVCDKHVVRDLNINISMSDNVKVTVPMHLLYELRAVDDSYRIARLAAHWDFLPMIKQLLGKGMACLPVALNLTVRMLRYQGLAGTLGFSSAAFNIGKAGRLTVQKFIDSVNNRDLALLMGCFCHDEVEVQLPYGSEPVSPSSLLDNSVLKTLASDKVIVSGDTVSMSFRFDDGTSGVAFFEFNRKQNKINALRFYY